MKAYNEQTLVDYYVDFDTENISFLKMAALLDAEGISNKFFFLRLDDKKLRGVDPYNPNLTDEMRFRIFKECSQNRWYFYREVFRIPENGASTDVGGGTKFNLSRGNLAYLWANELNISTYLIMPRQLGKTWAAIADAVWTHQFIRGSTILHFNKNQKDANDNLLRIQNSISMLPLYLQHSNLSNLDASEKRKVKNNEKTIRNTINSTIEAMASASNESKADALARGKTSSKVWYDELAYIFFNETIYAAATPAYEKAREIAEKNEVPYAISITTTPGDLATPHGKFAYEMMQDAIRFNESFYDLKRKKLYDRVYNTPDKTDFLFIQFSYLQLGETEEWFLKRAKKLHNPIKARREYLLEWINSNGNSPFDPDDLEIIGDLSNQNALNNEIYKINKYFELNVYSEYHGKKPVLIGVDVSGSLGRDCSAITVVNPETLTPMAFFKSNMIPSNHLKKLLITIVTKRYPHCILTIENNSIGKPLLDELQDTAICRCLYKERKKRDIDQGSNTFTKKRSRDVVEYGHNVNGTTRSQMMEMLESIVHNNHSLLAYPELYEELRHLELKNGRIDHGSATHDDVVMSYLGVLWVVRYGTGLKGKGIYYNIDDGSGTDDTQKWDTRYSQRFAKRLLLEKKRIDKDDESSKLIDFMQSEQHLETSSTLAEKERREYYKALDQIEGITIDDELEMSNAIESIPDDTERLILRNFDALMNNSVYDDPTSQLLNPAYISQNSSFDDDWSTIYKY